LLTYHDNHNWVSANRPFLSETKFLDYLQELLRCDSRFENVRPEVRVKTSDGQKVALDIMFSRNLNGQEKLYIIEAKNIVATTEQKIESAIQQLEYYRNIYPHAQFILAVPVFFAEDTADVSNGRIYTVGQ